MPVVNVKGLGLMRVAQQSQPQATAGINSRADKQRAMQDAIGGAFSSVMPPVDDMRDMLEDPDLLKQALDDKFQEVRGFVDMATQGLTPLQKAAFLTMPYSGLGDFAQFGADMEMYITDPESRTWFNAAMTGTGVAGGAMSISPAMAGILPIVQKNIGDHRQRAATLTYGHDAVDPRYSPRPAKPKKGESKEDFVPVVGVNDAKLVNSMETQYQPRSIEVPELSIVDLEGKPFMTTMSDRTAAGGLLTRINGTELDSPIDLRGGQDYMFDAINEGQVWASDPKVVAQMRKAAEEMYQITGERPLFMPWRMAPTGGDYATMTSEAMINHARQNLSPSDMAELDWRIRSEGRSISKKDANDNAYSVHVTTPEWKGIADPRSTEQLAQMSGDQRKAMLEIMDKNYRNKGGLSVTEARLAVSDPTQLTAKETGLQNVGLIDMSRPDLDISGHPTYGGGLAGEGMGRLKEDVMAYELLPNAVKHRNILDPRMPNARDNRSLQMKPFTGIITEDLIRGIMDRQ